MDNDNKKSAGGKVQTPQTEQKLTANSVAEPSFPSVCTSFPAPKGYRGLNYFTTKEVSKIIGVTKQAVEKWRKLGWFNADLVTHDGVYLYSIEHVEQLKSVYRRDWQKAWRGETATDSEKKSVPEMFAYVEKAKSNWRSRAEPTKRTAISDYFANQFDSDIEQMKAYSERTSGFYNLDQYQFFHPGLYVIGATPAAGKTTFCWQLLEQLARKGETCIYCSYEMSQLELFSKSLVRELFKRVPNTELTAADIRRGAWSVQLAAVRNDFAKSNNLDLSILELQDESIDDLLTLLKPFCLDKAKAPVICLDYLQIVPTSRESAKLGIDDSVRKLKKFQRDTNTTFIIISSFNRTNYAQSVSFESFKESGNIEYTADVVWALQLYVLNFINSGSIADIRKRIDKAKKKQPRQIQLKCLKNRQGTNYDCYFNYFSAHDYFEPCEKFIENKCASSERKQ